jgi:hypothetical protein
MTPRNLKLPGIIQVALQNTGNAPAEYSLVGREQGNHIQFQGERGRIRLVPDQLATIDLQLEPRSRSWFGSYETYGFEIEVASRSGARQTVSGNAEATSILPKSLGYGPMFAIIFLCILSGLLLGRYLLNLGGSATPPPTLNPFQSGTATAISATQTAAALGTPTATGTVGPLGDRDNDGLSDAQEAVVGSQPDIPDSDGDGLLDGQEVFDTGTSPTNRDTDGDGLTDGEEVLLHKTNPLNPDTDGDSVNDGVEIATGKNPLNAADGPATPTATWTATPILTPSPTVPSPTPTWTATPSATPSATTTGSPSITPTWTPTATGTPSPTTTGTATATGTATETPTATPTGTATETPTATPTNTPPPIPNPLVNCTNVAPTLDGIMQSNEWGLLPMVEFGPQGSPEYNVVAYFLKDSVNYYLAFQIGDPTDNELTDSLRLYFDVSNNAGDPDSADRFFQIARDGTLTIQAGTGTNIDSLDWDSNYSSNIWSAVVGEPGGSSWVVEMSAPAAEMPLLMDGNPFKMMSVVLYTGLLHSWPVGSITDNAGTWQLIDNQVCP